MFPIISSNESLRKKNLNLLTKRQTPMLCLKNECINNFVDYKLQRNNLTFCAAPILKNKALGFNLQTSEKKEALFLLSDVQKIYIDEIEYLNSNNLDYSEKLLLSKEVIEDGLCLIEDIFDTQGMHKTPDVNGENSNISFVGNKHSIEKQKRKSCNLAINVAAALCAGISAAFGEMNLAKADIPFLLTVETAMFTRLACVLGVTPGAAVMHGLKHAGQAGIAGMGILKTAYNIAGLGAHAASVATTGGAANGPVSIAIRAGNAGLSALMCETMGRAFLKDYEDGKMTTEQKTLEFLAFATFLSLTKGFESILDLEAPAELLEEKIAKAAGRQITTKMPKGIGIFIKSSIDIANDKYLSFGAKGLEMIVPVISSYAIEHKGEIEDADIAEIIKGSVISLACNEYFGHSHYFKTLESPKVKAQMAKIMTRLKNDPTMEAMIKNEIKSSTFNAFGCIDFNNKNLAKNLEKMYDELVPVITDYIRNMRFD